MYVLYTLIFTKTRQASNATPPPATAAATSRHASTTPPPATAAARSRHASAEINGEADGRQTLARRNIKQTPRGTSTSHHATHVRKRIDTSMVTSIAKGILRRNGRVHWGFIDWPHYSCCKKLKMLQLSAHFSTAPHTRTYTCTCYINAALRRRSGLRGLHRNGGTASARIVLF